MDSQEIRQNEDLIIQVITAFLETFQFHLNKRTKTWWKSKDQILHLISFQKARWGDEFYLNIGFYFELMNPLKQKPPKSPDWHFWSRFETIGDISKKEGTHLFRLKGSQPEIEANAHTICEYLKKCILPEMEKVGNYPYLSRHFNEASEFEGFWIQHHIPSDFKHFFVERACVKG
ncbi:DUF4304 domain-containing protein [Candidatus Poribacteria bacterium]|nr:DUF4304 domain-containing protein [Candidatus Poribacteria bacterium]